MRDLSNNTLFIDSNDPNENYPFLTTKFQEALNKYALLKKVCKETMFSLRVKNLEKQYTFEVNYEISSWKTTPKWMSHCFKIQQKYSVLLRQKCIWNCFSKLTESGVKTEFWKKINCVLTNKGSLQEN